MHRMRVPWSIGGRPGGAVRVGLVVLAVAASTGLVGTGPLAFGAAAAPGVRVCDASGSVCGNASRSSAITQILPLQRAGDGSLMVRNVAARGPVTIGVVAFLDSTGPRPAVLAAPAGREVEVVAAPNRAVMTRLESVPRRARAVVLQLGGRPSTTPVRPDACAAEGCGGSRVVLTVRHGEVTRFQLAVATRRYSAAVRARLLAALAGPARIAGPGRLTARLSPRGSALEVAWHLFPGTERVSAIRIVRTGRGADGTASWRSDRAAPKGSTLLRMLRPEHRYTVTVAPIVDGVAGVPLVLSGRSAAARTARGSAAAGSGDTADSADWAPLYRQDFSEPAAIGAFRRTYPGWAAYDGGRDTSRTTARAAARVGVYDSTTTSSVHDGHYDCRVHTLGGRPRVCALTPTPDGRWWPGQRYGRYRVRFRTDSVPGYKIAWLLWPSSDDWDEGEIDFPEGSLDGTITASAHRVDGRPWLNALMVDTGARTSAWHVATIEWRPGRLAFVVDGRSWTTHDPAAMPRHAMRWALQVETEIRTAAPAPSAQGHVVIDWLSAERWAGRAGAP